MDFWNSVPLGLLFGWFSVSLRLHVFNNGVYVTMLIGTVWLVVTVMGVLFVLLLGFAFAPYVVLGSVDAFQYNTVYSQPFTRSFLVTTDFI